MKLDPLDARLVALLQEDARLSYRDLAEKLGVSTPTVSARVKDLEDLGVLHGYHAHVEDRWLGGALHVVTVRGRPSALPAVAKALAEFPGTEEVLLVTGGELVARVRVRPPASTLASLHAALAALPDVAEYESREVLEVAHHAPFVPVALDLDVPCHECKGPIHGEPVRARFGGRAHVFCCRGCLGTFRGRFEKVAAAKAR